MRIRLLQREREILWAYAKQIGVPVSEVVRDWIKGLEKKLKRMDSEA